MARIKTAANLLHNNGVPLQFNGFDGNTVILLDTITAEQYFVEVVPYRSIGHRYKLSHQTAENALTVLRRELETPREVLVCIMKSQVGGWSRLIEDVGDIETLAGQG